MEFQAFEGTLCKPDGLYRTVFQLFDMDGSGYITHGEFEHVIKHTLLHEKIPFNFNSEFMRLHFGKDKQRFVSYAEFSQVIHDFHEEHAVQAFRTYDKKQQGNISAVDFSDIMISVKSHLLTEDVKQNLVAVAGEAPSHVVTFPYFMAFNSLLNNMELVKKIYLHLTRGNTNLEVTKEELLATSLQMSQITPLEIDILFELAGFLHHHTGRITFEDLEKIAPYRPTRHVLKPITEMKAVDSPADRGIGIQILESIYRFVLGSFAGGKLNILNDFNIKGG